MYFIYFDTPASLPNKIDLETTIEQKVTELTASSLPGKGYKILLVLAVESDKENKGRFIVLASWNGKTVPCILKVKIALGNRVALLRFCINDWLHVPSNKSFLKSGIFLKKTNFQLVKRPPRHLPKTIGCWITLVILCKR